MMPLERLDDVIPLALHPDRVEERTTRRIYLDQLDQLRALCGMPRPDQVDEGDDGQAVQR
jgi:hypothetical protein